MPISDTGFNITSPLYPSSYSHNLECTWTISNVEDTFLELFILKADFDRLDGLALGIGHVIDDNTIMVINGVADPPNSISVAPTNIWIAFTTDSEGSAGGFNVFITASKQYGAFLECNYNIYLRRLNWMHFAIGHNVLLH